MKKTEWLLAVFLLTGLLSIAAPISAGSPYLFQRHATGDWGGARTRLHGAGVDFGVNYTAEPAAAGSGGYDQGNTCLHNINCAYYY